MELRLTSPAFNHGMQIPSKYTCDGMNINPHLVIHGVPERAKTLVLIMEDPDAPGGLWVHWVVWNIPHDTKEIRENTAPFGATEGVTSWRESGYGGPCPPSGTHRYFFRLFALDTRLQLSPESGKDAVEAAMAGHIVASAELMGTYMRTNEAPL